MQWPHDRAFLNWLPRRADGHVEAGEVGAVVDRDPVVGAVVEVGEARAASFGMPSDGTRRARRKTCASHCSLRDAAVELVGVVDPVVGVAGRILGAEQEVVADVGAEVDAEVAVGDVDGRRARDPSPGGAGTWCTSWRSARVRRVMPSSTPAMRLIRALCGPGDVDDDRRRDLRAVRRARRRSRGRGRGGSRSPSRGSGTARRGPRRRAARLWPASVGSLT